MKNITFEGQNMEFFNKVSFFDMLICVNNIFDGQKWLVSSFLQRFFKIWYSEKL